MTASRILPGLVPYLEEQTILMRRVLREAGVQ